MRNKMEKMEMESVSGNTTAVALKTNLGKQLSSQKNLPLSGDRPLPHPLRSGVVGMANHLVKEGTTPQEGKFTISHVEEIGGMINPTG